MIWTLLALLAVGGPGDPRIGITAAQLQGDLERALRLTEDHLEQAPAEARALGFDFLKGHLLERLGRTREAHRAFADSLAGTPSLAAFSRYRLALNESRGGHPEVAAGLLATLLANGPPRSLLRPASRLLAESLAAGGDCRLLAGAPSWPLDRESRRLLEVTRADCSLASAATPEAAERLLELLSEDVTDEPARLAADRLDRSLAAAVSLPEPQLLVGLALFHQRRFEDAIRYLGDGLTDATEDGFPAVVAMEARYALARALFRSERYLEAAAEFGRVATSAARSEEKARALYQRARAFELVGSSDASANSFRLAYLEDPDGRWADAALLSLLRLELQSGNEQEALRLFELLGSRREWSRLHRRAALFLVSSDLVRGRSDRAGGWLEKIPRAQTDLALFAHYWQGRLDELQGHPQRAVSEYAEVLADSPFHPLADLARERLTTGDLEAATITLRRRLESASTTADLYRAWLLASDDTTRDGLAERLLQRFSRRAGEFLAADFVAPEEWPLWRQDPKRAEDVLLALGLWAESREAVARHFPPSDVSLGYTGSRLLTSAGAHRDALQLAETLHNGALIVLPAPFVPSPIRRAAFPLSFGSLIAEVADRHAIDPFLLTAVIREESRFDPQAISPAGARGLAQMILPTAQRLARRVGLQQLDPEDLHRPETSLALAAAYLSELAERFARRELLILAAYNAGEPQAELWRAYCLSDEPAEYLTKVGFPETSSYLGAVLTSRGVYRDLYPEATFVNYSERDSADPSTRSGSSADSTSK